jgi:hypothetical protein
MKTAEEILQEEKWYAVTSGDEYEICQFAIEFAKIHVKAAIKECIESAPSGSSTDTVSYEDVVEALKDCYPESNIK